MSGTLISALLGLGAIVLGIAAWMASTAAAASWFDTARAFTVVGFLVVAATLTYWIWTSSLSVPARTALLFLTGGIALGLTFVSIVLIAETEVRKLPILFVGKDPNPGHLYDQKVPSGGLRVYLGAYLAWSDKFPHIVVQMCDEEILTIDRRPNGSIVLSVLRLYDERGKIILRFDGGEFWSADGIRVKRPDKSTIVVYNTSDKEVLNVKLLNLQSVYITGVFHYPGIRPIIVDTTRVQIGGMNLIGGFGKTMVDLIIC
jgi:hypothetical protein